ncbi:hypothetical protein NLX86_19085 [Streptomyces sp. A3M-1-3]|uniref:hypothetical protein n=1 Tax=Streptomyces sp. A3M-1-3 TaxID=2962044 RepID=UPI0020B8F793|nr:hypothetical protein [Streptomyces sp. A3M-1-3]MCP3820124.1 hypothetical protein [Streptomyces sp. A3M-1-3]
MYTTTRFERVPLTATKSVPCTGCGKKVRRQRTFEQTINPYNKNADGIPKSRIDILHELKTQADAWQAVAETHTKCEGES